MKLTIDYNTNIKEKAKELVARMTLEEKAGLCSGRDCWNTKAVERLGLHSITMMDGPHGLRKQTDITDNLGIGESVPAVCFPTASALACSFDRELIHDVGKAMGEECQAEEVSMILGPGVNQKRSPLCGRNFEYYSEDPILSGELAASMIMGIQSTGTGTSLKHFAVNNQEKRRMSISAVIDERTLRETYLKSFEIAVKKGKPHTVMCSYNRVNGEYCSENKYLLTDILRKEWGFEGAVISDWGAVHDRVLGIKAGLDLEMPGNQGYNDAKIIAAVKNHSLLEEELDQAACRVTELILKSIRDKKEGATYNKEVHHQLAVRAAEQSAVLLKNDDSLLPGHKKQKVAVIGMFAKKPRYQGAGSSKINPIKIESTWDVLLEYKVDASFSPGYQLNRKGSKNATGKKERVEQERLINEACEVARDKDVVYLFAGLTEGYESEGFDRKSLQMPEEQNHLIEAVSQCNPNVVVILSGGAPMELTWFHRVKAVLLGYLNGEGGGRAIANLLLGLAVPCGKLAETWPLHLKDTPSYNYFPGGRLTVEHRESIYVGYRYYEKIDKPVMFSFGYGLSYVDFKYSDMKTDKEHYSLGDKIDITFHITNQGNMTASETAMIYIAHENPKVFVPKKELKEFVKVELVPGETKEISVCLDTSDFGYYNTIINDWYAESGMYQILIGASSNDLALSTDISLDSPVKQQPAYVEITPNYFKLPKDEFIMNSQQFETLYGKKLPVHDNRASRPYTMNHTLEDVNHTWIGKIVLKVADKMARKATDVEEEQEGMITAALKQMPFYAMITSGDGMISESMVEGILDMLNGHYIRGIRKMFK